MVVCTVFPSSGVAGALRGVTLLEKKHSGRKCQRKPSGFSRPFTSNPVSGEVSLTPEQSARLRQVLEGQGDEQAANAPAAAS